MIDEAATRTTKAPWHLWLVGVLGLLWNSLGAFDYLMTQTRNASYLASFSAEQLAYFTAIPKWVVAAWALGVWGGVLGSLLLLLRRRQAAIVLAVSLASAALTFVYNFVLSNGLAVMGGAAALVFPAVILIVAALLLAYSRRMAANRTLR